MSLRSGLTKCSFQILILAQRMKNLNCCPLLRMVYSSRYVTITVFLLQEICPTLNELSHVNLLSGKPSQKEEEKSVAEKRNAAKSESTKKSDGKPLKPSKDEEDESDEDEDSDGESDEVV